jgi:hypothetical protein
MNRLPSVIPMVMGATQPSNPPHVVEYVCFRYYRSLCLRKKDSEKTAILEFRVERTVTEVRQ